MSLSQRDEDFLKCSRILIQNPAARQTLGFSEKVWEGLTAVLTHAIPVLEQQSFAWKNPSASNHNGSSSDPIAANFQTLAKDIERLNDLCTIARNLLATTKRAQNLAADKSFDQQILKLIHVCVRVTARGFDGETNSTNEGRWNKVVHLYKRLLITCLQFLHNFIMHNEHRKLVLWLDLFGSSQAEQEQQTLRENLLGDEAVQVAKEARIKSIAGNLPQGDKLAAEGGLGYNIDDVRDLFDLMNTEGPPDADTQEAAKILMDKIRKDMERLSGLRSDQLDGSKEKDTLEKVGSALKTQLPPKDFSPRQTKRAESPGGRKLFAESIRRPDTTQTRLKLWTNVSENDGYGDVNGTTQEITAEDLIMPRTAQSAAETLQEAKDELIARLQDSVPLDDGNDDSRDDDQTEPPEDDVVDSAEDSLDEEDDDYRSLNGQDRGLLTDVPLVLGPSEIEALPMIIQAGIVSNFGSKPGERLASKNMQAVRCHILLAQEAGRNVLRELLIFIAAWDLPDDEFYFKMMVQIMEAILQNGLMSHAYSDFGQSKDIISPAQAVVIKILTHIFRAKYSPTSGTQSNNNNEQVPQNPRVAAELSRVDVLTVRYIFTVFRGNIIPETCALIYLQGQIRNGLALAEDFPLNLWDMERVYEGVYQFLEFFAVLTENNEWKKLLVDWEIVYDLVTLIKELDASIPNAPFIQNSTAAANSSAGSNTRSRTQDTRNTSQTLAAAERPYDANAGSSISPVPGSTVQDGEQEADPQQQSSPPPTAYEDPATFEWRNLKKLIVLVLSSLVWKNPFVQDQIRAYGGVEVILGCTQYDGHNPYIKEHAVMCLKFLLEGNDENKKIVSELEGREIMQGDRAGAGNQVDMLRDMGVEVSLDKGKVKITTAAAGPRAGSGIHQSVPRRRASEGSTNLNNSVHSTSAALAIARERLRMLNLNAEGSGSSHGRVEEVDD